MEEGYGFRSIIFFTDLNRFESIRGLNGTSCPGAEEAPQPCSGCCGRKEGNVMKLSFAAIFFLAAYYVGGFAQQATPDLVVTSRMVVLDVAVTYAQGKPVLDLRKDDFRVYEDNVPQSILNLEPPSVHMVPVPPQTVGHLPC